MLKLNLKSVLLFLLQIIDKMKVIPLERGDTERCVNNFHSYANEIRMNIPELILATMELLFKKYEGVKEEEKAIPSPSPSGDAARVDVVSSHYNA